MPNCPKVEKCPFFHDRMASKPSTAELYKRSYCQGDNSTCARWVASKVLPTVPLTLFPNQLDKAKELIAAAKSAGVTPAH
jgi:hypothetical protein